MRLRSEGWVGKMGRELRTRQVVAGLHLDRVRDLVVAEHVAPHVDAVEVLDGAVGVAVGRRAIVGGRADALKGAGVDTVDVDGLDWKGMLVMIVSPVRFTRKDRFSSFELLRRCNSVPAQPRRAWQPQLLLQLGSLETS